MPNKVKSIDKADIIFLIILYGERLSHKLLVLRKVCACTRFTKKNNNVSTKI